MNRQRITVQYEGRVQGVGFRYTVLNLTERLEITGWIRNEADGSVLLVAEGAEDQLMELLQTIHCSHLGRYITQERVQRSIATGEFTKFGVRH